MNFYNQFKPLKKEDDLYITQRGNLRKDHDLLSKISASLDGGKCVVLFYFDIARFHEIEQGFGLEIAQYIIKLFNGTLAKGLKDLYKKNIKTGLSPIRTSD